jgi:UDP-N-acetylglucosamine enolpyruvyl transferase
MAAAATGGRIRLDGITTSALPEGLRHVLADAGVELTDANGTLVAGVPGELQAVRAATGPHPGLPTDTAPQLAVCSAKENARLAMTPATEAVMPVSAALTAVLCRSVST